MKVTKVNCKPLEWMCQLRKAANGRVITANFTDDTEDEFVVEFRLENGKKQDLTIVRNCANPGKPLIYISQEYCEM